MITPSYPLEIVTHQLERFPSTEEMKVFLHSGFHTSVAASDIAGLPKADDSEEPPALQTYGSLVASIPEEATIAILFEHPEARNSLPQLQKKAQQHKQLIVAPLGLYERTGGLFNSVAVARPEADLILLDKVSLSYGDFATAANTGRQLLRGTTLNVFETETWKLAILNCHDYTHADVLNAVLGEDIDVLIVTTRNPASRLFEEYAIADIHRLCCFVIVNNVSDYGGSGVYAPFSRLGNRSGALTMGGTLFSTRGACEVSALVSLPLGDLRDLRENFQTKEARKENRYQYIDPPERIKFFPTKPPYHSIIADENNIETIDLESRGYRRAKDGPLQIAVAQLSSMSMQDYLDNSYHISRSPHCKDFIAKVRDHLELLSRRMASETDASKHIDFLVFPEVFLPLTLEREIKAFSQRWNTIVIGGLEYDPQPSSLTYGTGKATGTNRCRVYIPTAGQVEVAEYVKLTRSQYDARFAKKPGAETETKGELGYFPMTLGDRLLRFRSDSLGTFGVLICYDLSQFDIVCAINLGAGAEPQYQLSPLDTLFIIAHNPYAELYRRCCLADCHRFYQYVVMCNVAQYGGSGVFGPLRTSGDRRTLLFAGKNAEGIFHSSIDVTKLNVARATDDHLLTASAATGITSNINGEKKVTFQRRPGCYQTRSAVTIDRKIPPEDK